MTLHRHPTVASLSPDQFQDRLRSDGLGVRLGPFDIRIQAAARRLHPHLHNLYSHFPLLDLNRVFSGHVSLRERWNLWPQPTRVVRFKVDARVPHEDMPAAQALAVLEWGINLVISLRFHRFLMLHCAVLERNGRAILLPAAPGDGKTTLCAALAHRGWRLLSDEFGLLRPGEAWLLPVPRPMPLKNESIAVIRRFAPEAFLGPEIKGTRKGTVAHVRPPKSSVESAEKPAPARWIVFPRWRAGVAWSLRELAPGEAFMRLATNAFNYELLGEPAFLSVRDLVQASRCFRLEYSDLTEAVARLGELADSDEG